MITVREYSNDKSRIKLACKKCRKVMYVIVIKRWEEVDKQGDVSGAYVQVRIPHHEYKVKLIKKKRCNGSGHRYNYRESGSNQIPLGK